MNEILDAAYFGEIEVIGTLLDDDVDVNTTGQDGNTPLHMAVLGGHTNCVKLLIEKKANVDAVNSAGNTLLHLAVTTAPPECVRLLLEAGAPVNSRNNSGDTPLDYAIDQTVSYTIPEDIERHLTLVELLLQSDADAKYAHNAMVEQYQPRRLQTGTRKRRWKYPKYRRALLEKLIQSGLEPGWTDEQGNTLLHVICCSRSDAPSDDIKLLLENGFDVNARNHAGDTPLLVFVNSSHPPPLAGMKALLQAEANVDAANNAGRTPVQIVKADAARYREWGRTGLLRRYTALYTVLIEYGADDRTGDSTGVS